MIICVCNTLNDKDLKQVCRECPLSAGPEGVMQRLGHRPKCGQCLCFIEEIMAETSSARPVVA